MSSFQVYCGICAGPFLDRPNCKKKYWLSRPVVWTTVRETTDSTELDLYEGDKSDDFEIYYTMNLLGSVDDPRRHLLQMNAEFRGLYNSFALSKDASTFKNGKCFGDDWVRAFFCLDVDKPFYIATHQACNEVAQRFIESRKVQHDTFRIGLDDEISSFKQLWQVLYYRMPGGIEPDEPLLPHPYGYYGGSDTCIQGRDWIPEEQPKLGEYLESDPIDIPSLTESILNNLEPASSISQPLDQEDQTRWCSRLTREEFPWLWDLDQDMIHEKQRLGNWDWQLLVQKLSQLCIHEVDDTTMDLPAGLRNRRRIWRCIEEARAGDVPRTDKRPKKFVRPFALE